MFVLTNVGWLLFRETELAAIVRDLTLSPFGASQFDRQTGTYLFLLSFGYPAEPSRLTAPNKPGGRKSLEDLVRYDRW